jgi:hypothetical protein
MTGLKMQVSRSRLFVLAIEEFIRRRENRRLLQALNDAYDDVTDSDEQARRDKMRQQHRQLVKGQW